MDSLIFSAIYFVGLVVVCGFAIICVILKNSAQAVDPEGSLRKGFRSLGTYIYFGIFELFKELFSKKTLKGFLWLIGLCILMGGFAGLIYLLLM